MAKQLIVFVTRNDPRLQERIAHVGTAAPDPAVRKLWDNPSLGSLDGGGQNPLVLFGHANTSQFVDDYTATPRTYLAGGDVAARLKVNGLKASTFPFCVIAGCSSAGDKGKTGLFVNVGDGLQLPTLGSTTSVRLRAKSDHLLMTPEGGGKWKVYFPDEQIVYLLSTPRCQQIREALSNYVFRADLGGG